MAPNDKFLKLALYNAGSLNTGHDDFLAAMNHFNADIVAINETWLPSGQEACAPAAPGYRLRMLPRPPHMRNGRGGGVAFYVKRDISVRFVKSPDADIEQLWLSTKVNGYRLIIGTAYRPQWISVDLFLDALTESVTYFSNYDHMVLLGDFNVNLLADDSNARKITQFLNYTDLKQVVTEPTHFTSDSDTLIDLVCTNCRVRHVLVSNITGSIGHAMVNVSLSLKKIKIPPRLITFRPLKNIDLHTFNKDLDSLDWKSVSNLTTAECLLNNFYFLLLTLFDKHAPYKTITIRSKQSLPWMTDIIQLMIGLRNQAHENYRKSKLDTDRQYYKDLKSLVIAAIASEKRAYFNHYVNSNIKNSKIFWKNLKEKVLVDPGKSECLPDCFNDPNLINDSFLDVPGEDIVPISELTFFELHRFGTSTFHLQPVSESEVFKYILSIKSNAVGKDGISRDMLMLTMPRTLTLIADILNKSIVSGTVPIQWKEAVVNPLSKVDQPHDLKDLRPISILPYLSKILEKIVYNQLSKYVENNNILPTFQSGFRKGRGTVTTLLDVTDNILAEQDRGCGTILTLLDFSRAFDSINIPLLLSKLAYYGFDHHSIMWFNSYLSNRSQSVKLSKEDGTNIISRSKPVTRGVPQGSILGPLLFIIYSADLAKVITSCKYHCYADDVQLYISATPDNITQALLGMTEDLHRIADWSDRNALVLNPSKSKYLILGSKNQVKKILLSNPVVNIRGQAIERVEEVKNLGVILDSDLRFESHVLNLVRNCFYRLKVLYKIRNLLSEKARITVCESLILSRLNYGDLVYGPRLLSKTQRLVQRVQNACCRFCFNVPARTHISPYLNNAELLNMSSRRQLHLASLMFDVVKFKTPVYLHSKLKFPPSGCRSTRPPLATHLHRTVAFTGSFRYQATKCWNNIPPPLRSITSKCTFKAHLKINILNKQKMGTAIITTRTKSKKL